MRAPRVQIGLTIPAHRVDAARRGAYVADVDRALRLVAGHFHGAWVIDHLQSGDEGLLEGFTTLSYLAARHPRLLFGHTVLCQSFRNPALVAKMGATLQFLSGGRFILGMGAGWDEPEYRAYGYDFPPAGVRVAQLDEALRIVKALWTQERATFEGRHYRVRDARCEPRPDPLPPILVGAFRPRMLRLAAEHADWWDVSSTGPERYRALAEEFDRACAAVGRDAKTVRRSTGGGWACAPARDKADALAGDHLTADEDDFSFIGTPEQVIEQVRRFVALGVTYFMVDGAGFPDLTTLETLISQVVPALND